jgi:hypothetical protein
MNSYPFERADLPRLSIAKSWVEMDPSPAVVDGVSVSVSPSPPRHSPVYRVAHRQHEPITPLALEIEELSPFDNVITMLVANKTPAEEALFLRSMVTDLMTEVDGLKSQLTLKDAKIQDVQDESAQMKNDYRDNMFRVLSALKRTTKEPISEETKDAVEQLMSNMSQGVRDGKTDVAADLVIPALANKIEQLVLQNADLVSCLARLQDQDDLDGKYTSLQVKRESLQATVHRNIHSTATGKSMTWVELSCVAKKKAMQIVEESKKKKELYLARKKPSASHVDAMTRTVSATSSPPIFGAVPTKIEAVAPVKALPMDAIDILLDSKPAMPIPVVTARVARPAQKTETKVVAVDPVGAKLAGKPGFTKQISKVDYAVKLRSAKVLENLIPVRQPLLASTNRQLPAKKLFVNPNYQW